MYRFSSECRSAPHPPHPVRCDARVVLRIVGEQGEFVMRKLRSACVHLEEQVFEEIERRAKQERRPVSNLLRCIVEDAIGSTAGAGHETAGAAR
jgi:hypothetical protein